MQRRALLRRTAALGAIGLAGCLSDGGSDSTPTESPTPEPPAVDTTSVETTNTDCASDDGGVASFDADASNHRLTVTGTVQASDPCHLAELTATELDDDTLSVTVGTRRDEEQGVCIECVGAIGYEATVTLTVGLTAEVVVEHESGEGVDEVARETVEL